MLVLSRHAGEKIVIGNEVIIEVLSAGKDGVRLGITAPADTSVHRFEVFQEIQQANRAASAATASSASVKDLISYVRARDEDESA